MEMLFQDRFQVSFEARSCKPAPRDLPSSLVQPRGALSAIDPFAKAISPRSLRPQVTPPTLQWGDDLRVGDYRKRV
jgi:hypothetical protein